MLQLVFSIIALIAAAVFGVFLPGTSFEAQAIAIVTGLAGAFGVVNWRTKFNAAKEWFQSKTVFGALIVAIPVLILTIAPMVGILIPEWLVSLLTVLVTGGGGTTLWGIFDAVEKKSTVYIGTGKDKADKSPN